MVQKQYDRPWLMLVTEFATATTMHGIRFLAEPTKFLGRRYSKITAILLRAFCVNHHGKVMK